MTTSRWNGAVAAVGTGSQFLDVKACQAAGTSGSDATAPLNSG